MYVENTKEKIQYEGNNKENSMIKVKKIAGVFLTAMLSMTLLAGCGNKEVTLENDGDKPVVTVGDESATYWEANFQTRVLQMQYESMYGSDIWEQEVESGKNFEQTIKDLILEGLKSNQAALNHVKDYNITLTDDEKQEIEEQVDSFMENLSDEFEELTKPDKEKVENYLIESKTIQKLSEAVAEEAKLEVSDADARQMKANYVMISVDEDASNAELTKAKQKATKLYNSAKKTKSLASSAKSLDLEVKEATYGNNNEQIPSEIVEASMALKKGEITKPIKTDYGYYVIQCMKYLDKDATESAKESMLQTKQQTYFTETCEKWLEDSDVKVDDTLWDSIELAGHSTLPTTESTTSSDEATSEATTSSEATTTTSETTTAAEGTTEKPAK